MLRFHTSLSSSNSFVLKGGSSIILSVAPVKQSSSSASILKLIACRHSDRLALLYPFDRSTATYHQQFVWRRAEGYISRLEWCIMQKILCWQSQVKAEMSMYHDILQRFGYPISVVTFPLSTHSFPSTMIWICKIFCCSVTWFKPLLVSSRLNTLTLWVLQAWTRVSTRK